MISTGVEIVAATASGATVPASRSPLVTFERTNRSHRLSPNLSPIWRDRSRYLATIYFTQNQTVSVIRARTDGVAQNGLSLNGAHSYFTRTTHHDECRSGDRLGQSWHSSR